LFNNGHNGLFFINWAREELKVINLPISYLAC
jgi:hypothetical protein